ncbi:cupin domain-containing protein [Microvirga rosea]|uniref:cupin domain-containing protein n=1 Tax=Microvirga rosea TaxID=2715425 RepID=UPI001D09FE37|nr:cupin domain-containing protein [Microvirga rosea]MCB8821254.1 cupin domain-containing protein [Microvirga rosea]
MTGAAPRQMRVRRAGEQVVSSPDGISSAPFQVEMLLESSRDGENTAIRAMLEPGTKTHWHAHPRGQLLYVLSGCGLVQRQDGPILSVSEGDSVWFAAGERHWHGASPDKPFSYISIQAAEKGRSVDWFEPVEPQS